MEYNQGENNKIGGIKTTYGVYDEWQRKNRHLDDVSVFGRIQRFFTGPYLMALELNLIAMCFAGLLFYSTYDLFFKKLFRCEDTYNTIVWLLIYGLTLFFASISYISSLWYHHYRRDLSIRSWVLLLGCEFFFIFVFLFLPDLLHLSILCIKSLYLKIIVSISLIAMNIYFWIDPLLPAQKDLVYGEDEILSNDIREIETPSDTIDEISSESIQKMDIQIDFLDPRM
jgi:hypothetical protein